MNISDTFWGEAGFEKLRKYVQQTSTYFGDIIGILDERAELETIYAKSLQKLASRLSKVTKNSSGVLDNAWKTVADSLEGECVIHKNLSLALKEEVVQPLRNVFHSQQKSKKSVQHGVDKATRRLNDKRGEQLRLKRNAHAFAKSCEKIQRSCNDENHLRTEKQATKLESKRMKLEENADKAEQAYRVAAINAERERSDLELVLKKASKDLDSIEQERLANLQTALQTYQCHLLQFGPTLTELISRNLRRMDGALASDVQNDPCQQQTMAYRTLVLCDFYAEDFSQVMDPERRKVALKRQLVYFEQEIEKEKKGIEGLQHLSNVYETTPAYASKESRNDVNEKLHDSYSLLNFLDFHLYKLQTALCSLEKKLSLSNPTHLLCKYEEKHKDKAGLRQTVLRLPLYKADEMSTAPSIELDANLEWEQPGIEREQGDGQSPVRVSLSSETDPIYESVETDEPSEISTDSTVSVTKAQSGNVMDIPFCRALYDFIPQRGDELALKTGDEIRIITRPSGDWWEGTIEGGDGTTGLFPTNYVEFSSLS